MAAPRSKLVVASPDNKANETTLNTSQPDTQFTAASYSTGTASARKQITKSGDTLRQTIHRDGRGIVQLGDDILRKASLPICAEDAQSIHALWQKLEDTLAAVKRSHTFRTSAGISAVQIGILKRACLIWTPTLGFLHIANPTLLSQSKKESMEFEGCLSFFDKRGLVPRPNEIVLSFLDHALKPREERFEGWAARIILHELDHMDGRLYTDRMRSTDKLIGIEEYTALRNRHR